MQSYKETGRAYSIKITCFSPSDCVEKLQSEGNGNSCNHRAALVSDCAADPYETTLVQERWEGVHPVLAQHTIISNDVTKYNPHCRFIINPCTTTAQIQNCFKNGRSDHGYANTESVKKAVAEGYTPRWQKYI